MTAGAQAPAAVLAVDGGNSKADLALVAADGSVLAAVRGPSISHQAVGLETGLANLRRLISRLTTDARIDGRSGPIAQRGSYTLAGADYAEDVRLLTQGIGALGLTRSIAIVNDTYGALRAGTSRPWGVVLICGHGINAAGNAPDGRTWRFDSVGEYAGDWGGGGGISREALAAAVRGRDGRGPRTSLERLVPAYFGVPTPKALTKALYLGKVDERRITRMAPIVFGAAGAGDAVARSIIDRLADELATMASIVIRKLRLSRLDPEVVLAGGVFRNTDEAFHDRLERGVLAVAPGARLVMCAAPPVAGAALLGLDRLSPSGATEPAVERRLRAELTYEALSR